ncbi:hypothetical protein [Aquimarina pacifica]|uniref:hypothetical protein n=1 Tax=Aquimarina pacifica TaxID=1296415 RepID=UPI0004707B61|nr:hypothetical protein [Aquimarina pacifica]
MKTLKTLFILLLIFSPTISIAQSEETSPKTEEIVPKENSSKETVVKTIRIKGANGEEKIIKKEEVITKKSKIELNPDDLDKTNQSAAYKDEEVIIEKSHSSSDMDSYTKVADEKGFQITLISKSETTLSKARLIGDGYYLVNFGAKDNCIGHFDKDQNFILETYNPKTDQIITTVYKKN